MGIYPPQVPEDTVLSASGSIAALSDRMRMVIIILEPIIHQ